MIDSRLQDLLHSTREEFGVVGATLGLLTEEGIQTFASGLLNLDTRVQCTTDSVFQIGSITKVFTATLLMQLVERRRLDIDDRVVKHIPEFALADMSAASAVTIRQLLNHTCGIEGDFFPADDPEGPSIVGYVRKMCLLPSLYAPGQGEVTYSNSGYVVAGRIFEVAAGMAWQQAVMDWICKPLRMPASFARPHLGLRFRCAIGHVPDSENPRKLLVTDEPYLPLSLAPAGTTLSMSAESLLLFAQAHLSVGDSGRPGILTSESVSRMQQETVPVPPFSRHGVTHWGLGWFLGNGASYQMAGHDGGTNGQFAYLRIYPEQRVAFVLLMNSFSEQMAQRIEESLVRTMLGASVVADPPAERFQPQLGDYVGRYRRVGANYRVLRSDDQLQLQATSTVGTTREVTATLIPYRPDVFEVQSPEAPAWHELKVSFCRTGTDNRVSHLRIGVGMARRED